MSYIPNPSNGFMKPSETSETLKPFETTEGFQFPPSVQSDLFNYLKPEQKQFIRPILRVFKKPAQEELCCALMDYLETGEVTPPTDITLGGIYYYCCQHLNPLHRKEPVSIMTVMKQLKRKYFPNARPLEESAAFKALQKGEV